MEINNEGWTIINIGHSKTGEKFQTGDIFFRRKDAIKWLVNHSGAPWKYWRDKFNFRCVRAEQTIIIDDKYLVK